MEVNTPIRENEQEKCVEYDALLNGLCHEGLLTDLDCRIIASCFKLVEKKAAVLTVIMSKTKEVAAILTESFRQMSVRTQAKENSTSLPNGSSSEENKYSILPLRNPLLHNTVIKTLFGFLPLEDIKRFRLVCREWNSIAEICLRKRTAIHFRHNILLPHTFMAVSKYSHPDLPFSSFVFSNTKKSTWQIFDIQDFLKKWEKNLEEVTFNNLRLVRKYEMERIKFIGIRNYDVTPLFINPSNITSLKIKNTWNVGCNEVGETTLDISLEKFVSIKTLSLSKCNIIVPVKDQNYRIAPLNVQLKNVNCKKNGEVMRSYYFNDLVDFSRAVNIDLYGRVHSYGLSDTIAKFDMAKQVFSANQIYLKSVILENWAQATGDVQFLYLLDVPFVDKNNLKIKQLQFMNRLICLSALPQTLEILDLAESDSRLYRDEPLCLHNLKYLRINAIDSRYLTAFENCVNLVELAVWSLDARYTSIDFVPQSVKRMIIKIPEVGFADECIYELDTLILDCSHHYPFAMDFTKIAAQVKAAKVLVVIFGKNMNVDTSDILKLVQANKQSEKIVVGSITDLHKSCPFQGSDLAKYVDKKSNYYQFENKVGKSITKAEFQRYANVNKYYSYYLFGQEDRMSSECLYTRI